MNSRSSKFGILVACIVLCEPSLGDGIGKNLDVVRGSLEENGPTPPTATIALDWGEHTTLRNIQTQTMLIRHTASEYQRRVAGQNAKAFFVRLTPAKKYELRKKHIKTVLITTARSAQTSPGARDVRMRYSLEGESLIDDYAYEFQTPLQAGTVATTKSPDPEYVGM